MRHNTSFGARANPRRQPGHWESVFPWPRIVRESAAVGAPGISLDVRDTINGRAEVAEYRDASGVLRAVAGFRNGRELTIVVDPMHRRKGIASELMTECLKHWRVDFAKQSYTPDGKAFFKTFLADRRQP